MCLAGRVRTETRGRQPPWASTSTSTSGSTAPGACVVFVAEIPARHGPVTIRTELSDFGIPLHVEAPPADQVFDPQALDDAAVPNTA